MPNIMAGSLGGVQPSRFHKGLAVLSIVINNRCNLTCKHCYLEPLPIDLPLTREDWLRFFRSVFAELKPAVVAFAGKEVFVSRNSARLLFDAIRARDEVQSGNKTTRTRIGVITNGTLLHRFQDDLLNLAPDYLDISVDGLPDAHDAVRGHGAYNRLRPNLHWVSERFADRVWVTHTLLASNVRSLPEFVCFYSSVFGLGRFSIGLYKPLSYTSHALTLQASDCRDMITETIDVFARSPLPRPIEVAFDLEQQDDHLFAAFRSAGYLVKDKRPVISEAHRYPNGLTIRVNACRIPVGLWRAVRVTPEGYWLAAEDLLYAREYASRAVARLRDCECDAALAYRNGLRHSRFRQLLRSVSATDAQMIRACTGGVG